MWDVLTALGELFSLLWGQISEPLVALGRLIVLESWDIVYNNIKDIFTFSASRFSYINVLSSLGIALAIYVLWARRKRKIFTLRGAFQFIFPKHVWQHPLAWVDVRYYFVCYLTTGVIVAPVTVYVGTQTFLWCQEGFSTLFPTPLLPVEDLGVFALLLIALSTTLIFDISLYLTHYLQHKIPFLWEFHKVHHSALVLHPFTNYREHFVDNLTYGPITSILTAVQGAFFLTLLGYKPAIPTILGVGIATFLINFVGYNLRHSHIWFAFKPYWLGYIVNSPAHHQIHHSKETQHLDKNFGSVFALWDWAFGTLHLPRERETFRIGLTDNSEYDYSTVWRILWVPFAKAFKLVPQQLESPPKTQQPAE